MVAEHLRRLRTAHFHAGMVPAYFGGVGMDKKFIGLLTVMVLVCAALLIAANYSLRPAADNSPAAVVEPISSPGYIEKVFVADQVTDIHIDLAPADFADMMQNPTAEEYKEAAITVNGQTVEHVGFGSRAIPASTRWLAAIPGASASG